MVRQVPPQTLRPTTIPTSLSVVTGSSSGIGRGAVELALSQGDKVIATLRKPEVLSELTKQYTSDKLLVLKLDTTNNEEVKSVFKTGREHFGRVDVVYSNAGIGINAEVESTPEEDSRAIIAVGGRFLLLLLMI